MADKKTNAGTISTAYLAMPDYLPLVKAELKAAHIAIDQAHGPLLFTKHPPIKSVWSQNIWFDVKIETIASVGDAVKKLKAVQRNWALYPLQLHRRCALIQDQLPKYLNKPIKFMQPLHQSSLGSWTLLKQDLIAYAGHCRATLPNGEPMFDEDRVNPPSRAYLKLWELFTMLGKAPNADDHCLDLGACPGGWTWVLGQVAGKVTAIDRSPLAENVSRMPSVEFRQGNAFTIKPADLPDLTWLCSDLICYPDKLYEFLQPWLDTPSVKNFVCTIKFQGDEHYDMIAKFASIAGSEIYHLSYNKHELTWTLFR